MNVSKKKRIAILLPSLVVGGSTTLVLQLFELLNRDSELDVWLIIFFDFQEEKYAELLQKFKDRIIFLKKRRKLDIPFLRRLKTTLEQLKPDVVSTHLTAVTHLSLAYFGASFPFKIYHTVHSVPEKDLSKAHRFLLRRRISKNEISFIGVSKKISDAIAPLLKCRVNDVFCIPNGVVLPNRTSITPPIEKKYDFLCVGRFSECKNFPDLIRAFSKLVGFSPKYRLCICGYGELHDEILSLIKTEKLGDYISVFGKETDVSSLYAQSKIFCLFSSYEGNPITILEAESYGLPVIATNVGGIAETVEDGFNGVLLKNVGNIEEESKAMAKIANSPELLRKMSEWSLEISKRHSIEITAERYKELFER